MEARVILAYSSPQRRVPDLEVTLQLSEDHKTADMTIRRIRGSGPVPDDGFWMAGKHAERFEAAMTELRIHMLPHSVN